MDDDDESFIAYPTRRLRLSPCQYCGRKFQTESLRKHENICRNVFSKKRRVFDAGRQRATGSDVPYKATRKTAQIYNGEIKAQNDTNWGSRFSVRVLLLMTISVITVIFNYLKNEHESTFPSDLISLMTRESKSNWREKHRSLIESIREARLVTQALNRGGPLPTFRPSQVPSDYVTCPYCRRNFNEHAAKRHIPFCQTQHERKQQTSTKTYNRGFSLPPIKQRSSGNEYKSFTSYSGPNSAPMMTRRTPVTFQSNHHEPLMDGSWTFRKLFGLPSKETFQTREINNYSSHQQPIVTRTGRTQTNISGRMQQRSHHHTMPSIRRVPVASTVPNSYRQQSIETYSIQSFDDRCNQCGSPFGVISARFCSQCGAKRFQ